MIAQARALDRQVTTCLSSGGVGRLPRSRRARAPGDPRRAARPRRSDALRALRAADAKQGWACRARPSRSTSTCSSRPAWSATRRDGRYKFHHLDTTPLRRDRPRAGREHARMRINLTSVLVDDQDKALAFYTDVLGFVKKTDVPLGEHRWLTVVSPDDPDGTELRARARRAPGRRPFKRRSSRTASRSRASPSTTCTPSTSGWPRSASLHSGARRDGPRHDRRARRHVREPDPDRERHGFVVDRVNVSVLL